MGIMLSLLCIIYNRYYGPDVDVHTVASGRQPRGLWLRSALTESVAVTAAALHIILCEPIIWRVCALYIGTPTPRPIRNVRSPTLNLYKPKTAWPTWYCRIRRSAVNWSEHRNQRNHGVHCEYNYFIAILYYYNKLQRQYYYP